MASEKLRILARPKLTDTRMLLGFSGWMNGGDASTGTIEWLAGELKARKLAEIEPEGFYIYNFPGSMEIAAMFRPHCTIRDGLVTAFDPPRNEFRYSEPDNLILFTGKEPNLAWPEYAECMFSLASAFDVRTMYFVGSVAGVVPHTRDPRLSCSVSEEGLKDSLQPFGVRFTNYDGPASLITFMLTLAGERGMKMATLVAEIPAYVQGKNPRSIEAVSRKLAGMLGLKIHLDRLRRISDEFERKVDEVVQRKPELVELIRKLENDYDNELFDTEIGDLKEWLEERGIRPD